jgi:predicted Zn-dependent protease
MHIAQPRPRFLSEADCHDILTRLHRLKNGGGFTAVTILSYWSGNVRWARNEISTAGEVSDNWIEIHRIMDGATGSVMVNETTDAALVAGLRQAERLATLSPASQDEILEGRRPFDLLPHAETPQLFSEVTYQVDANQRAGAAIALAQRASTAGMLSAGYIEVSAHSRACIDTTGRAFYDAFTRAQYSVTVRSPSGSGSGWAGMDHHDWSKIDPNKLTTIALDKCLKSQNPVRVEPGRYTTILEPQAVYDFVSTLLSPWMKAMDLADNLVPTTKGIGPFNRDPRPPGYARFGEKIIDERITISADPMDADMSFPPYGVSPGWRIPDLFPIDTYRKVTWIERGVLTHLAYDREEAIRQHDRNIGILNSGAFRMTGGTMTLDEMIASTKRGLLVTRFDQLQGLDFTSQLYRGYTRDGLWLVENGKISKAAKNLACTESTLFALNNIEQLGVPQRIFQDAGFGVFTIPDPAVVPPLKIRDFSFTALTDAV